MKNPIITPRLIFMTLAIFAAAMTRLLPHPWNFTAVGGMALFAGACIPNRWLSLIIPMSIMFLTDLVLGFHNTMIPVYFSFALITMLGWWMSKRQGVVTFVGTSLLAGILFFFITNAAMWVVGFWEATPLYSRNISGLYMAIAEGIPFYSWNFLISQFVYGGILFGILYGVKVWKPSLVKA
jgi:hypothetical protein